MVRLLLVGPSGSGKTLLASKWADDVPDEFPSTKLESHVVYIRPTTVADDRPWSEFRHIVRVFPGQSEYWVSGFRIKSQHIGRIVLVIWDTEYAKTELDEWMIRLYKWYAKDRLNDVHVILNYDGDTPFNVPRDVQAWSDEYDVPIYQLNVAKESCLFLFS